MLDTIQSYQNYKFEVKLILNVANKYIIYKFKVEFINHDNCFESYSKIGYLSCKIEVNRLANFNTFWY